ncbi:MAG: 3-deoxy-manno-octulosonate cytidylyltransferase [Planctomycetes bacterium]|nr:3-deoxy-manno-octulosonate cytidylyltransferase [Planctomycetota bacterium]
MTTPGDAAIILPARRASSRLPEKLLLAESGKPLFAHTLERCLDLQKDCRVIAAVDCKELAGVAHATGAEVVLTDPELASGSDRVWAAAKAHKELRYLINVQGDEPEIDIAAVRRVLDSLRNGAEVVTLAAPLPAGALDDPSAVKLVRNSLGNALYFSRAPIPHARRADVQGAEPMLHIGVYGYTRETLASFATALPTPLERCESLEQLRFLEHGVAVRVLDCAHSFPGIDTREDYDAFLRRIAPPPSVSDS